MLVQIFTVIAPVAVITALGYIWERRKLPFDTVSMSYLVSYIGTPCLMLHTLVQQKPDFLIAARVALAAALMLVATGTLGWIAAKAFKLPPRTYIGATAFPNAGNMGLPLCLLAFGPNGLAFAVAYAAVMAAMQFSVGASLVSGHFTIRGLFASPVVIAIAIAGVIIATDTEMPMWIDHTLEMLGNIMIPLMILSLGTSLAKLKVTSFSRNLLFAVLRVGGGFAAGVALTYVLGLEGAARGSVIIQSAMPMAVFTYMFAVRYDKQPEEVAAMVFISTILSFVTLPLLMAFVLGL